MNLQQLAQEPMEGRRNIEISWGWLRATVKLFHKKELQTGHAIFDRTWKIWKDFGTNYTQSVCKYLKYNKVTTIALMVLSKLHHIRQVKFPCFSGIFLLVNS